MLLFYAKSDCGFPIGNLTSQLFGNIYLNDFDHFVKRDLKICYYGRYVDDIVLMHRDKTCLKTLLPIMKEFLWTQLRVELHPAKIYLQHHSKGVKYLGTFIKPHRIYIANRTKGNFYQAIQKQNQIARDHKPTSEEQSKFLSSMNSYLGIMRHYKTYKLRKRIILENLSAWWRNYVFLNGKMRKFELKTKHL